ncbi:ammonium transporter AmtB-like domain-containing protein [Lipomyces orientalis]|uniref:Ammonium transporter AmtB-like domain-containing protein n=1 Tax=Lipomyces orientalis TaxID=1233043 RepID=A0ACC3TTW2_9ASCO
MAELPSAVFNDSSVDWTAAGGNSRDMDVNVAYVASGFHQVWMMSATVFVFPIIPGLGLFYAGLCRRKSATTLLWQSMGVLGVISFQWFFWGYSLAYAADANPYIGTLTNFGMRHVVSVAIGYLPEPLFALYQCMFALCTVMIMIGGAFERARLLPSMIFAFCWATIVYCPIVCWTWNAQGWLFNLPALDFAGGGPVHISSGTGALAYALVIGKRLEHNDPKRRVPRYVPHNPTLIFIGTWMIWFGWFGFNGGSTLNASVRTSYVLQNTNLAAATGVIGFSTLDYVLYRGRFSLVGACQGCVAGLVAITPAAGFVPVYFAALIGFLGGVGVRLCANVNEWLRVDEGMEVFKLHAIGGIIGAILTGLFAADWVSLLDGATEAQGWVDHNYIQLGYQLAEICAIVGYTFVVTVILLLIIDHIPGLKFRVPEHQEIEGLDKHLLFEEGMGDYELAEALRAAGFLNVGGMMVNDGITGVELPAPSSSSADDNKDKAVEAGSPDEKVVG